MQPINRETYVDRRQPTLRWSAVFAGALCSIGFWILLQLIGVGLGLTMVDPADTRSLHSAGIGTTTWSLVSPLIATLFGGLLAGKLAQTYDRKLAGAHGLVMWAITSIVGLCATIYIVSLIAKGAWMTDRIAFDNADEPTNADRIAAIHDSGKALAIVGFSLLLSLITAAAGAMLALRRPRGPSDASHRGVRTSTEAGYPPPLEPTSTMPNGAPIAAPASPVPRGDLPPR
jgi:MFS family permease